MHLIEIVADLGKNVPYEYLIKDRKPAYVVVE